MKQTWKPSVKTKIKQYWVSDFGGMSSSDIGKTDRTILQATISNNYMVVTLDRKHKYVHKLVAEAFLGPKPPGAVKVVHKDGNTLNNAASNLKWSGNKLSEQDRREIIKLCTERRHNKTEIAKSFGISRWWLYHVLRNGK